MCGSGVGCSKKTGLTCKKKKEVGVSTLKVGNFWESFIQAWPCIIWLPTVSPPKGIFGPPESDEWPTDKKKEMSRIGWKASPWTSSTKVLHKLATQYDKCLNLHNDCVDKRTVVGTAMKVYFFLNPLNASYTQRVLTFWTRYAKTKFHISLLFKHKG